MDGATENNEVEDLRNIASALAARLETLRELPEEEYLKFKKCARKLNRWIIQCGFPAHRSAGERRELWQEMDQIERESMDIWKQMIGGIVLHQREKGEKEDDEMGIVPHQREKGEKEDDEMGGGGSSSRPRKKGRVE